VFLRAVFSRWLLTVSPVKTHKATINPLGEGVGPTYIQHRLAVWSNLLIAGRYSRLKSRVSAILLIQSAKVGLLLRAAAVAFVRSSAVRMT
jgi:hypothetical protein